MEAIGGYFELELANRSGFLHDDGVLLNSGRNALEYVFRALGDAKHVWIPYYTCDVMLEPITKLGIPFSFYRLDERLELKEEMTLQVGDYLLYTNYFGIKDGYVKWLAEKFGSKLVVDNAQAWYANPIDGTNTIYSPRKYVGIPDGGIAYCLKQLDENCFERDDSYDRCSHLLKRIDVGAVEGYHDFKDNDRKLCEQPIRLMSKLTKSMLESIDFEEIKRKRMSNFEQLHELLKPSNKFDLPELSTFACPMVYPYLTDNAYLRRKLIENQVFVATYWQNVLDWTEEGMLERELVERLLPIPCDQRVGKSDIDRIISILKMA